MQDAIVREITVKAPKEQVYKAMTDPAEITSWFPDAVEGNMTVGEQPFLIFTEQKHRTRILVEAAKPYSYFAFRWVPGSIGTTEDLHTVPNTLVEFTIEEVGSGTKVTVKESGFADMPAEVAQGSYDQNTGGWTYRMGRLEKVMNAA